MPRDVKIMFPIVAVLEARKLKKMDITGASDPYVKLKLFDSKVISETRWSARRCPGLYYYALHNHNSYRRLPVLGIKITTLAEMPGVASVISNIYNFFEPMSPPGYHGR